MNRVDRCCLDFKSGFVGNLLQFLHANFVGNSEIGLRVNCVASVGFSHSREDVMSTRFTQLSCAELQVLIDYSMNAFF
jgi:hypothetical protein